MIELPANPPPREMVPSFLYRGTALRGAATILVDRPGTRYSMAFAYPSMTMQEAAKFVGRLQRAKREGLRVYLPLVVPQGSPGSPVVDGAGQSGVSLAVRGLAPRYPAKEGYWLTIVEADGTSFLHTIAETTYADDAGLATLEIEPALRAPFPDGATIHLAKPYIDGFVDGDVYSWTIPVERRIEVMFTVEEFE